MVIENTIGLLYNSAQLLLVAISIPLRKEMLDNGQSSHIHILVRRS